ncbi:MAG: hypothetical protein PUK22_05190 [Bacteroides sp.]|nr:hypothetical protein [Bacteroides sp.]MDD7490536.1 hypothetical protein [Bacteroides sp.]
MRHIRLLVTVSLICIHLIETHKYAGLLHIRELVIDRSSEHFHRRRTVHIGIDKRRNARTECPHGILEISVVALEIIVLKNQVEQTTVNQRHLKIVRTHKFIPVTEVLPQEVNNKIPA